MTTLKRISSVLLSIVLGAASLSFFGRFVSTTIKNLTADRVLSLEDMAISFVLVFLCSVGAGLVIGISAKKNEMLSASVFSVLCIGVIILHRMIFPAIVLSPMGPYLTDTASLVINVIQSIAEHSLGIMLGAYVVVCYRRRTTTA